MYRIDGRYVKMIGVDLQSDERDILMLNDKVIEIVRQFILVC